MNEPYIHTPDDGRGPRVVLLNGKPIGMACYADELRGIVRVYDDPPRLDKYKKRILTRTLHGKVEVVDK